MSNVTIKDIKDIGLEHNIFLSDEQLNNILSEYNRVVIDKAGDWTDIVKELISHSSFNDRIN